MTADAGVAEILESSMVPSSTAIAVTASAVSSTKSIAESVVVGFDDDDDDDDDAAAVGVELESVQGCI